MKNIAPYFFLFVLISSCSSYRKTTATDNGRLSINFVQINDVYEIAPLNAGKEGGMARVATIKKNYLQQNPNTFLVIAGDFLSPSVYNSLKYGGDYIRGKQMVEVMNAAGMDIAVFGNHELDLKESELQQRINESNFQWISSNTFHKQGADVQPFAKNSSGTTTPFPQTLIKELNDADGTRVKIGFIGINLPFTKAAYVQYEDPLSTAKKLYAQLKDSVDAVVAITHQSMEADEELAKEVSGLALIIGGHEHDQRFKKIGKIYITKALANAKSAYVLKLDVNKKKRKTTVTPKLEMINESVAIDSTTNIAVQKWLRIAGESFASLGFNAEQVVISKTAPLEGRETEVRSESTNLTKLIVASMQQALPDADVVLLNGGSIRIDDVVQMPVTQYDVIRILPFGGGIKKVDMLGSLLIRILDTGVKNRGTGGFLHYNENLRFDSASNKWVLNNTAIDAAKTYRVGLSEFLLTGGEANLGFLTPDNKEITKLYDQSDPLAGDIRKAIISYAVKEKL